MSTWTDSKIARDLSERDSIEPPEGLLEKLKADIPPDLGSRVPPAVVNREAEVISLPERRMPRRQSWLLAASLILTLGGGLLAAFVVMGPFSRREAAEVEERVAGVAEAPAFEQDAAAESVPEPEPPPPAEVGQDRTLAKEQKLQAPADAAQPAPVPASPEAQPQARREAEPAPPPPPPPPPPAAEVAAPIFSEEATPLAADAEGRLVKGVMQKGVEGGASYTVVRSSLRDGRLPPREAIRVEELVNYFSYGDPAPSRGDFALKAEGAASIFTEAPRTYLLRFNVRAREELTGTLRTVAEDAKVQVELSPDTVSRWRRIGYENRDDPVDLGEIEAGHGVTVLYEVQLTPQSMEEPAGKIASLRLRYREPVSGELREMVRDLTVSELVADWKDASPGFRLASLVVEFAEILRGSSHEEDHRKIQRRLQRVVGEMQGHPRAADIAELERLVEVTARLKEGAGKK